MHRDLNLTLPSFFWNEKFWLPDNFDWNDFQNVSPSNEYGFAYYILPVSCCLLFVRHLIKTNISAPLGKFLGLKERLPKTCKANPILEREYNIFGKQLLKDHEKLNTLAKKGMENRREVERWIRKRSSLDQESKLEKFCECHWKVVWYSCSTSYAFYILWDSPWFWDISQCYTNFHKQMVPKTVKWYFIGTTGYSMAEMLIQFYIPRKKDHWELVIHHFAALFLQFTGWYSNLIRLGSLMFLIHDISGGVLQLSKIFGYFSSNKLRIFGLVLIIVSWVVTRLMIFPFLIHSIVFRPKAFRLFPAMIICVGMLLVLQCLHIIWSFYLYKVVVNGIVKGKVSDVRSASDSSS